MRFFFLTGLLLLNTAPYAQNAMLLIHGDKNDIQNGKFYQLKFNINGISFKVIDGDTILIPIRKGFDYCQAIFENDTLDFLAKFKNNQTYFLRPGCCCATFEIVANKNSARGTVKMINKTKKDKYLVVCEHNQDTVPAKSRITVEASESTMCYFKPCMLMITETDYNDEEFRYSDDGRNYREIFEARDRYILAESSFLFLHGERITIGYHKRKHLMTFKLEGYLKQEP